MSTPLTLTLTINDLRRVGACSLDNRIKDLCETLGREVPSDEAVGLGVWWNLPSTSVADMVWSLRMLGQSGGRIGVELACIASRRVLPIISDNTVREDCAAAISEVEAGVRSGVLAKHCRTLRDHLRNVQDDDSSGAITACLNTVYAARCQDHTLYHCMNFVMLVTGTRVDAFTVHTKATLGAVCANQRADLYRLTGIGLNE